MSLTLTAAVRANKPKRNVNIIAGVSNHSMALQKNGRAWGWGYNSFGNLGDNSTVSVATPVSVLGAVKTFCKISAGGHSLAIDKNGRAWAWGFNNVGQLGNNTTTSQRTPVSVLGAVKTFCQINAGRSHSLAIDKNGRAWAWGNNTVGELGNNTITNQLTPVSVLGAVKTFCKIAAGSNGIRGHCVAIDKNGRAWGWGYNFSGELGNNTITSQRTPVSVLGAVKTFCEISSSALHTLAIDKNGRAWGWGSNAQGQLGNNSITSQFTPVSVLGAVKTFCKISAGIHSLAVDKYGRLWAWGENSSGQLGDNTTTSQRTPISVLGAVKTFCEINAGESHSLAIDKNGRAWAWGSNSFGKLGDNNPLMKFTPVSVAGALKTFCQIAGRSIDNAGGLVIDKNGRAWAWGSNSFGQVGNNTNTNQLTPVSVLGAVKTFCKISSGHYHSIAIDKNGRAWAWGRNGFGEVGNNTITNQLTPVSVLGAVKTFCEISATRFYSLSIDKNGRAWGWGYNYYGTIGDNTTTSKRTPVSVAGAIKTFCKISGGDFNALAIDKNGKAWGWGYNYFGTIGNNTTTNYSTPVAVAGTAKTFCHISAGYFFNIAIDKNGRAWGWGYGGSGRLGDNTTTSKRTPVSVAGAIKTFCQISCGLSATLAIDKNGRAWAWGANGNGQLGNNSFISQRTPVSVLGAVKTFCKIAMMGNAALAIDKNGRAWGWGNSGEGQLGNDFPFCRKTPVQICNI